MTLKEQYPTLAKEGMNDAQIRRVLISRNYTGRIGGTKHRISEILFSCDGDLDAAERKIREFYPDAFTRSNESTPTLKRLSDTLRWDDTVSDVAQALRRKRNQDAGIAPKAEPVISEEVAQALQSNVTPPRVQADASPPMDRAWRLAEQTVGRYPYTLLYGPPGTGKTSVAIRALREKAEGNGGGRVVNLYITPETTAAELMGYSAPDENGNFRWRDGPLTVALRNGFVVVINEIDDVGGDAETCLLGVLDDQDIAQYELMSGETIRPAPGFAVVATMNGDPDSLRPALADRFPIRILCPTPHPGALDCLPADLREPARKSGSATDPAQRHSLRAWLAFAVARDKWGYNEEDAAFLVWQGRAEDMLNAIKMQRRRGR